MSSDGTSVGLKPLAEIYGETPTNAMDAYGIRLENTAFYQNNPQLKKFIDGDTVICCLRNEMMSKSKQEMQIEAFKVYSAMPTDINDGE